MHIDEKVYLDHHGVRGQKWGIRRNQKTGIRPIANTLDKSKFGDIANRRVQNHMKNQKPGNPNKLVSDKRIKVGSAMYGTGLGMMAATGILAYSKNYPLAAVAASATTAAGYLFMNKVAKEANKERLVGIH